MEIKGKFATAISYAKEMEPVAEEQIRTMCDQQFTEGCRVRNNFKAAEKFRML